jgi:hypothetical protein
VVTFTYFSSGIFMDAEYSGIIMQVVKMPEGLWQRDIQDHITLQDVGS